VSFKAATSAKASTFARSRGFFRVFAAASTVSLASCAAVPRDAPQADTIRQQASITAEGTRRLPYALVYVNDSLVEPLNRSVMSDLALTRLPPGPSATHNLTIAPGDILSITVFEGATGGVFGSQPDAANRSGGATSTIPNQQVDAAGYINVPFVGSVHVGGLTAKAISEMLAKDLAKRALEPQVVVTVSERRSNMVSVLGDVATPTRFALDPGGITLLEAIARSGGTRNQSYDTIVHVQRGGRDYRTYLSAVVHTPSQNVRLASGDVVFLTHEPRFVTIFGATNEIANNRESKRVDFQGDTMTMSEALARLNGLSDVRADPAQVFLLRQVPSSFLSQIGVDGSHFGSYAPAVFAMNFREAEGLFAANHLSLQDRDIIVVADSTFTDLTKLARLTNDTLQTPVQTATAIAVFKRY
jgi:polysaccharide export outer membrane protein